MSIPPLSSSGLQTVEPKASQSGKPAQLDFAALAQALGTNDPTGTRDTLVGLQPETQSPPARAQHCHGGAAQYAGAAALTAPARPTTAVNIDTSA